MLSIRYEAEGARPTDDKRREPVLHTVKDIHYLIHFVIFLRNDCAGITHAVID